MTLKTPTVRWVQVWADRGTLSALSAERLCTLLSTVCHPGFGGRTVMGVLGFSFCTLWPTVRANIQDENKQF